MLIGARSIRQFILIAIGAIGLVLVGCGSDSADAQPPGTTQPAGTAEPTATGDGGTRVASEGDSVLVHYHGTLDDGEVFDSSLERDPLMFVVGSGGVIKGFDDAVRGMAVGETVTVRIPPADAYGELGEPRVFEFPAAQAPEGLAVGDAVSVGGLPGTVTEVTEESVTVTVTEGGQHELAGKALTFEIELVEIR